MAKRRATQARTRRTKPASGRRADMDASPSAVLAAYGHTMLVWQVVEQHLGGLWVASLAGEHQLATDRNLARGFRQTIHAATKATAAESLKGLKGLLDAELYADLEAAIKWRDLLAHRYLRERLRGSIRDGHFMAGTSDELGEIYDVFADLAVSLENLIVAQEQAIAEEVADMPDELVEAIGRAGRAIFRNEPLTDG